ncbi:MAG TPA: aldehyde dehydrogenase family protein [Sphingopyxis sp.]|nr:aldehyde dehydrogenase family protein [Sphingopyxis sp.]HMP44703.1 aldehyde dehydrogenase family protein [Sphingopyxis sp.]HMQ18670.1 aldehyde dehydrogenase family protein [Sphingopyxis sp.]
MSGLAARHEAGAKSLPVPATIIGGERIDAHLVGVHEQINPTTGAAYADIPLSSSAAIDEAVAAAKAAFPGWRDTPPERRREILERLAALIAAEGDSFAHIAAIENGVPVSFGHHFVALAVQWTRYYAGWADRLEGLCANTHRDEPLVYTIPEPFGVVAIIITWNAPLLSLAMKIPPALAAGNTVVLKPAEFTPFTATRYMELAKQAGLPDGVLNLVLGDNEVSAALTRHTDVAKISFTGGPLTATKIMAAASTNLTPVLFELGGKGANLVFADADLEEAIPFSARMPLLNAGQGCALPTRLLVERPVYDRVVEGVAACFAQFPQGDPLSADIFIGPLINAAALDRVTGFIERAKAQGAERLVHGGGRCGGDLAGGYFVEPTIFADVDPASDLAMREIFGPVLSIIPFDDEEQGLAIANGTEYGLTNYVQTSDMRRARRLARRLRSGTVGINGTGNMHVSAPFGGVGISGFGREGGLEGIREFTGTKTVLMG